MMKYIKPWMYWVLAIIVAIALIVVILLTTGMVSKEAMMNYSGFVIIACTGIYLMAG